MELGHFTLDGICALRECIGNAMKDEARRSRLIEAAAEDAMSIGQLDGIISALRQSGDKCARESAERDMEWLLLLHAFDSGGLAIALAGEHTDRQICE